MAHLTESVIENLQSTGKQRDVRDDKLTGFMVRVNTNGSKTYFVEYARGKRIKIGRVGEIDLKQARLKASNILNSAANGLLTAKPKTNPNMTYNEYLEEIYYDWLKVNKKSYIKTYKALKSQFKDFGNYKLTDIKLSDIERWRNKRFNAGIKTTTINRNLVSFKASLARAVDWELLEQNPLIKLKQLRTDGNNVVRYLSSDEAARLYSLLPTIPDHIQTMVIVSLNTALRKGELLSLTWDNIKLDAEYPHLIVQSEYSKSGKTRIVPLNQKAQIALKDWKLKASTNKFVFTNPSTGKPYTEIRKYWDRLRKQANLENFRWHDLRHECASKLIMKGVDLYTVSKVLGHSDTKMTQRYAHLAPKALAEAVAKLD